MCVCHEHTNRLQSYVIQFSLYFQYFLQFLNVKVNFILNFSFLTLSIKFKIMKNLNAFNSKFFPRQKLFNLVKLAIESMMKTRKI